MNILSKEILYYEFRTEEEMMKLVNSLESKGYCLPCPELKPPTFRDVKKFYPRNKIFLISAYHNNINNKYEYSFTTKQIAKHMK